MAQVDISNLQLPNIGDHQSDEPAPSMSSEDKARAMGWVPQGEWRGDKARWVDADQFLERGEHLVPVLRERTDAMAKKIDELQNSIKQFADYHSKTEQRAYERAVEMIKREMKAAVKVGDEEAFDHAQAQYERLTKETEQRPQSKVDPEFEDWRQVNTWYGSDKQLTALANSVADMLVQEQPELKGKAFLKEVERQVKEVRPDKFRNPAQDKPPSVHGGESTGGSKPTGKGYRDLPAEAKMMCDQFVKAGLLTKEQYAKDYFGV